MFSCSFAIYFQNKSSVRQTVVRESFDSESSQGSPNNVADCLAQPSSTAYESNQIKSNLFLYSPKSQNVSGGFTNCTDVASSVCRPSHRYEALIYLFFLVLDLTAWEIGGVVWVRVKRGKCLKVGTSDYILKLDQSDVSLIVVPPVYTRKTFSKCRFRWILKVLLSPESIECWG